MKFVEKKGWMLMKKRIIIWMMFVVAIFLMTGCQMLGSEKVKLRDLDFTVQSEEVIPEELLELIKERQMEPFKFTFTDREDLYICIGYGEQERGGYSITVDSLYLTEDAIYVETTLLGPENGGSSKNAVSYPYIVIKTESLDKTVVCE